MVIPGPLYRQLRDAHDRGHHRQVIERAADSVTRLDHDPGQRGLVPAAMLLIGSSLAAREHFAEAIAWLERGLAGLPGTPSAAEAGDGHWHHRLLADLYLVVGRRADAARYLDWLARPEQPLDSRLAAVRGQLALATARGRFDQAHLLVNAAADLARRRHSTMAAALVEGDRALVVSAQGRLGEAVLFADGVVPRLAAVSQGPVQAWANAQAVLVLTTLARHLAVAGDSLTAHRYLLEAGPPVAALGGAYWTAHLDLARGVWHREQGDLRAAEAPTWAAVETFTRVGAAPAQAQGHVEEARLAEARGFTRSALELYARAEAELAALGEAGPLAEVRHRAHALGVRQRDR